MRSMHRRALAALVIAALVPLAHPVAAQKAAGPMGALTTILPEAQTDGPWTARSTATGFTMTNRTEENAVRYFYVNAGEAKGARTVEVDVSVEPRGTGPALAGLLYGFDPETKTYFMLVIESGERIGLYRRSTGGMKRLAQIAASKFGRGPYRLALEEEGATVTMVVNGKRLGTMQADMAGDGATGIIAAGIGTFAFTGFSVTSQRADAR